MFMEGFTIDSMISQVTDQLVTQGTRHSPLLFAILVHPLLKDNWIGRPKFVDDTTALEIIPGCSPSTLLLTQENEYKLSSVSNPEKCTLIIL